MVALKTLGSSAKVTGFDVIPPQDNGWSLAPMTNFMGGLRGSKDRVALELVGWDGVVRYKIRTNNSGSVSGMLQSFFPQAVVGRKEHTPESDAVGDEDDWLYLRPKEVGLVQTLSLASAPYLPLKVLDDSAIAQGMTDPLAGVIGILGTSTRPGGQGKGDRLGLRFVLSPARADWNLAWQDKIQKRRDGEDRTERQNPSVAGPSVGTMAMLAGAAVAGFANWWVWQNLGAPFLVPLNLGLAGSGLGGMVAKNKLTGGKARPYMDEELVEAKLKSLAYWGELQLVRVYHEDDDELEAFSSIERIAETLQGFDDPAGNSWKRGPVKRYRAVGLLPGGSHPFFGGSQILDWLAPGRAKGSAFSAREVAALWHLPLGSEEMVSMERTAGGVLFPFLGDLSAGGPEAGPLVGLTGQSNDPIRLPESAIQKHAIIMGKSGVGKSTMIKHVLAHKLERKAAGLDNGAVVVIDPHAELVRDVMKMVPVEIADKVRLLDFGRMDRVPGINLVDPVLFPDRDRCVDTIIGTVKHLWEHWGGRLEDLLKRSLLMIYEYNSHEDTPREEMLTMLDILALLEEGQQVGQGANQRTDPSPFQNHVLSRVSDPRLKEWFRAYLGWDRSLRSEAVGPVHSRIGAYASDMRAAVIMGQRESTINLSDVLSEGLVLLVSTAQGTIGVGPAALMGGTMVSLVESALRDQESLPANKRAKCLLVCDEFQTVTGANWEGLLAEIRKYGCSLMLATQSLARLDTPDRKLKAGVLGNVGCIVAYQMSAEDARIIAPELDADQVQEKYLVNLHPHHCYVRINSSWKCYPTFSMQTLAPPEDKRSAAEIRAAETAVLAASVAYTTDWREARERMNREIAERLGFVDPPKEKGGDSGPESPGKGGPGDSPKPSAPPGGAPSPFAAAINATANKRVDQGNLRGIREVDIQNSPFTRAELSRFMKFINHDPALRSISDKRLDDKIESERRKYQREEGERLKEEAKRAFEAEYQSQVEELAAARSALEGRSQEIEAEVQRRVAELEPKLADDARVEMAGLLLAAGLDSDGAPEPGPKSVDRLRRVGPGL